MENEKNLKIINNIKQLFKFLGPAFIVSVAYIDPGNFATNISGGSIFNYTLLWVILWSNLTAIFLQTMSAKLGIATGNNLPEMCGKIFSRKVNWMLWLIAQLAIIATNLAEFLGATLGFCLLLKIPIIYAGLLTCIITFAIVYLEKYGQRVIEVVIFLLILVISFAYGIEIFIAKPDWIQIGIHTLIPSLPNGEAVMIAVGMLGATVMPHVIYLHSQLVQCRNKDCSFEEKKKHYKMEKLDIFIAMNIAFIVNSAMVIVSAAVFFKNGVVVDSIEQAHRSLEPLLGSISSGVFGIALLASGLSSSAVGTISGQTIMKGFVNLDIPLSIRRIITMVPALIIIVVGINPMKALVISQVLLSFTLPFSIIPMLIITKNKEVMGMFVNRPFINAVAWAISGSIICLNAVLLILNFRL